MLNLVLLLTMSLTASAAVHGKGHGKVLGKTTKQGDCANPDLRSATISALRQPPAAAVVAPAKKLAFKTCWNEWKDDLVSAIDSNDSNYEENACADLAKRKALSPARQQQCMP